MTSESTLKRRLKDYNIKIGNTYSIIEQGELEDLRRAYNVRAPLALWHINGNHKLIRWRFVIHGGIDGYSRLPVFLKVNTNNSAVSVLSAFTEATQLYGLPERVRSDKGGENVLVAEYMVQHNGTRSFITGPSVHNQRIERLWREVWTGCNALYYGLFFSMEDDGILDVTNERHMLALHLVFKPRIQQHLDNFREAIYHRPLRTERNKSPLQLWISGQMLDPKWNPNNEDELQTFGMEFGDLTS
ncbi:uncharacterized protein LOC128237692 [Mya arenaria]|uniref:uncharacterized protein LOC128237692 n=1 Tax=Mya arenaria TaxID=6604 RepID=UPI0022E47FDD|nr:uncharacterized protein LOC128237692 [Mya arenaria]